MTLQSIINFHRGQEIVFSIGDTRRIGTVKFVDLTERAIYVKSEMSAGIRCVSPFDVLSIYVPQKGYTNEQRDFVLQNINMNIVDLSRIMNKPVNTMRSYVRWLKNNKAA